jgi:hypothetical protein
LPTDREVQGNGAAVVVRLCATRLSPGGNRVHWSEVDKPAADLDRKDSRDTFARNGGGTVACRVKGW